MKDENIMTETEKMPGCPGTLYLCATPIGNLEDMTYRAVRLMNEVELIAAEDTRHTRKLLSHFDIHTRLVSYHEHNKQEKGDELIEWLLSGKDLLLVSDAGLPGIADPGSLLCRQAVSAGIKVSPVPGANAALSALICSGIDTTRFAFVGFLPKTAAKAREVLTEVSSHTETLIFYEAPHHLIGTLETLADGLGNRQAAIARELTKRFEEFERGTVLDLLKRYKEKEPRGEYVIIVAGKSAATNDAAETEEISPTAYVEKLVAGGMDKKLAMREAAKKYNMSRRDIYQALLNN